jgi:outer membrane protein assembly factor BamE
MMPRHRNPYNQLSSPRTMLSIRHFIARIGLSALLLGTLLATSACVYRIDIQQGNFLKDEDLDRVTVGMTRAQVRSLLGTPMVADPFNESRWDYVYYWKPGRASEARQRQFTVFFENDRVARISRSTDSKDTRSDSDA